MIGEGRRTAPQTSPVTAAQTEVLDETAPQASPAPQTDGRLDDHAYQDKIDRQILIGSVLIGTWLLEIPGIYLLVKAYRLHRTGKAEGRILTPATITIVAMLCLIDAWLNYLYWGLDLFFAHDTVLLKTAFNSVGRLWDGAYYLGFNTTPAGGLAISSEKAFEIASVLLMYPLRIVSAYGFMKMRRWGLNYMLVTSWMYTFFWVMYLSLLAYHFQWRFPNTAWGVLGWWIMDIWYLYPILLVPYLHILNRRRFAD